MKFKKARLLSPQSSIFGQLLFAIYSSSITAIAQLHGVQQQQYADDTQLYVALTPADPPSELAALESFTTSQIYFYPRDTMLARLLALALCPCLSAWHKLVFYQTSLR